MELAYVIVRAHFFDVVLTTTKWDIHHVYEQFYSSLQLGGMCCANFRAIAIICLENG
jgi:hypothetical protein